MAAHLNPRGFAVAGVAIRSSNHAQFPAQLHDIKAAIRWLRLRAGDYGLDPNRFATMGESSGDWTAAMAALTGDMSQLEGEVGELGATSRVQAAMTFYLPTDFLQMDAHIIRPRSVPVHPPISKRDAAMREHADGPRMRPPAPQPHADPGSPESLLIGAPIEQRPDLVQQANPITYISGDAPPFLLLHGELDVLVPYHQSVLLYEALSATWTDVTFITLPRGEHGRWKEFLGDPDTIEGATMRSSRACRESEPQPASPDWNMLINFLDLHLRGDCR